MKPYLRGKPSLDYMRKLLARAEDYRRFIPGWPALAESFEREAARIAKTLKAAT